MAIWASADEILDRFLDTTYATYDFRVYDETRDEDEGFITMAKVDLLVKGEVVHTESFCASSEFAPGPGFSAYGNGLDNHAGTQARSYAWAWLDARETPLEDRLAPFGPEWEREQAEGR